MTLKAIVLFRCGVQVAGVEDSRMAVPEGVWPVMWRVMGGRSGESWVEFGLMEEDIVAVEGLEGGYGGCVGEEMGEV